MSPFYRLIFFLCCQYLDCFKLFGIIISVCCSISLSCLSSQPFSNRTLISPTTSGGGPKEGPYHGPSPAWPKSKKQQKRRKKNYPLTPQHPYTLTLQKIHNKPLCLKVYLNLTPSNPGCTFNSTKVPCHSDSSPATGSSHPCTFSSPTGSFGARFQSDPWALHHSKRVNYSPNY